MGCNHDRDTPQILPFVSTYHPVLPKIQNTIRYHWSLLQQYYTSIPEFRLPPLMCNKRAPNLRDSLVQADIGSNKKTHLQTTLHTQRPGTFPCLHSKRATTSFILELDSVSRLMDTILVTRHLIVYSIKCPCGLLYIGETQKMKNRFSSHKSTIRCMQTWLPLPHPFNETKHTIAQLRFQERRELHQTTQVTGVLLEPSFSQMHYRYTKNAILYFICMTCAVGISGREGRVSLRPCSPCSCYRHPVIQVSVSPLTLPYQRFFPHITLEFFSPAQTS